MKTLKFYFSIIFTFFLFLQVGISQKFNPLYSQDIDLTDQQKEQLKAIEKTYQNEVELLYKGVNVTAENYDHVKTEAERKGFLEKRNEASKKVLTEDQLTQYEAGILEKQLEHEARMVSNLILNMNRKYPGMEVTYQQAEMILEETELARKKYDNDPNKWQKVEKEKKVIYKKVLAENQFNLYDTIEKEKKAANEAMALVEIKKAYPVAEQVLEVLEEFTIPKLKVLRKKLEIKIEEDDKDRVEQYRFARQAAFEKIINEELYPELELMEIENEELNRYFDFFVDLLENNRASLENIFPGDALYLYGNNFDRDPLTQKYFPEIRKMEAELLWVIKETVKKVVVIASEEYPIPPVSIILQEINEVPDEVMFLFLLLDSEMDFSIELPDFEKGEGQHFASVFPNPAKANQTLEFYLQQDALVNIEILDESGRVVQSIASENMDKGKHTIAVNTQGLNSQVYFYRITEGSEVTTLKFTVVK